MTPGLLVAVPAAVAAAAAFGTAGVLQHRATHEAPRHRPLSPALLVDLARTAAFRSGSLLGAIGFVLQVLALRYGPLVLVQPVLVTGLLFFLVVGAALGRRRPDRGLATGAVMAVLGLSLFLVVARPVPGEGTLSGAAALGLGAGLAVTVAVCLAAAAVARSEVRALPLAIATAVFYGATAALVRSLAGGPLDASVLGHWELYAVAVVGPAGFLLNQSAFQYGTVGAVALGTITVGDPLVAIGLGVAWLGESIQARPWEVAAEVVALAVMVGGVFLLALRAQRLTEQLRDEAAGATTGGGARDPRADVAAP